MKAIIEKWRVLPKGQKYVVITIAAWALTWLVFGALAAMSFGVGALAGFHSGARCQAHAEDGE